MINLYLVVTVVLLIVIQRVLARPTKMPAAKHIDTLKSLIQKNTVFVASKSWCPYCAKTKRLLATAGTSPKVVELDQENDGNELQQALSTITGMKTVPQVFIGGKFLGGNSDMQQLGVSRIQNLVKHAKTQEQKAKE